MGMKNKEKGDQVEMWCTSTMGEMELEENDG